MIIAARFAFFCSKKLKKKMYDFCKLKNRPYLPNLL